tara:strand:+ start:42 stop:818 length:777 start_codon:yes stop_codon:yes gene_type:complete
MKAVILAGGYGTRISEETSLKPKPMIEIGSKPILWHILKLYSNHGVNDFIVCCGYKGYQIKEYFANYYLHQSDVTFDMQKNNKITFHDERAEPWKVTLVDTGEDSMTGGRLKAVSKYLKNEDYFCMTYGDGLSDIDISKSIEFHKSHGKLATITAVHAPGRFGMLDINKSGAINSFVEKPKGDGSRINGGFFVLSPKVLDLIDSHKCVWEKEPLESLASENELIAYIHDGFWQPMDTLRDKIYLEQLYESNNAPWVKW